MTKLEKLIIKDTLKHVVHPYLLKIVLCSHDWETYGNGYRCCKCGECSGRDDEMNTLIKKTLLNKEKAKV